VFLLLASLEALLARFLPFPMHVPLLVPLAAATAMRTAPSEVIAIAVLAGLAREPWSGLPPLLVVLSTLLPCTSVLALHAARPQSPRLLASAVAAVTYAGVLVLFHAVQGTAFFLSAFSSFLIGVVLPSVLVGLLTLFLERVPGLWRAVRFPLLLTQTPDRTLVTPHAREQHPSRVA
jgi:hypothetical protein